MVVLNQRVFLKASNTPEISGVLSILFFYAITFFWSEGLVLKKILKSYIAEWKKNESRRWKKFFFFNFPVHLVSQISFWLSEMKCSSKVSGWTSNSLQKYSVKSMAAWFNSLFGILWQFSNNSAKKELKFREFTLW